MGFVSWGKKLKIMLLMLISDTGSCGPLVLPFALQVHCIFIHISNQMFFFTVKKLKKDKMTNSPRRNKNRIRNGKLTV